MWIPCRSAHGAAPSRAIAARASASVSPNFWSAWPVATAWWVSVCTSGTTRSITGSRRAPAWRARRSSSSRLSITHMTPSSAIVASSASDLALPWKTISCGS